MANVFTLFEGTNPAMEFRAFHMDCARHYFSVEEIKKMLKTAAYFDFNYFHWHISDDQGFRIESQRFPLLQEISAYRRGDHFGVQTTDEVEGGYYTRAEVKDIIAYAGELGIKVIPEIDIPGHVTAILAAYPNLSCRGEKLEVATRGGIFREILCAGKEETFTFIYELLDEMLELFPGEYFHIGGDEAPKMRWKECPYCQKKMKELGLENLQQYQGWMSNEIAAYLRKHGRKAIVWNEAARGDNLDPDITVQYWIQDKEDTLARHIARGGNVNLSTMMNSYCDYPYGFISLKSLYNLDLQPEDLKAALEQGAGRVIGNECLIWTEYIKEEKRLEELAWPRFAAAAAVGHFGKDRPSYEAFTEALGREFAVFEQYGIQAMAPEGWTPSEEEGKRQMKAFRENMNPALIQEFMAVQAEI